MYDGVRSCCGPLHRASHQCVSFTADRSGKRAGQWDSGDLFTTLHPFTSLG